MKAGEVKKLSRLVNSGFAHIYYFFAVTVYDFVFGVFAGAGLSQFFGLFFAIGFNVIDNDHVPSFSLFDQEIWHGLRFLSCRSENGWMIRESGALGKILQED